jgi:membrane protein implicated in regulation of membrane protease activity
MDGGGKMADWIVWIILAGVLVGLEIFSGTFYLLMVGIGLVAGGITALLGGETTAQFLVAAAIGVLATILLRKIRNGKSVQGASSDPNINLDIGQTLSINEWHDMGGGTCTSRAMYRGSMWDIDLMQGATPEAGIFLIREVRGSRLVVSNYAADKNREEA